MKVYLIQHAQAFDKEENPDRPITEKGRQDITNTARFLGRTLKAHITQIFHSPKLRAAETAAILQDAVDTAADPSVADDLTATADPEIWRRRLKTLEGDQILVGHLPHLRKLASLLLTGNPELNIVDFANAGIVCLECDNNNNWALNWAVLPKFF